MRKLIIAILLIPFFTHAQTISLFNHHGSYFIAAIGSDGIMIASDSRSTLTRFGDTAKIAIVYFDGSQKTIILNTHTALVSVGSFMFDGRFLTDVVKRFADSTQNYLTPSNAMDTLFKWCKIRFSPDAYKDLIQNNYVVAGFINQTPYICYRSAAGQVGCLNQLYMEADFSDFRNRYNPSYDCFDLGLIATECIIKYAKDHNRELEIGGDIRILKITPYKSEWTANAPNFPWKTEEEFFEAYKRREVHISFLGKKSKRDFNRILRNMGIK